VGPGLKTGGLWPGGSWFENRGVVGPKDSKAGDT